ncbi:MAG: PAS domain S-box protein, partial [Candidatus Thermoplasmatota archaeon]
MKNEPDIVRQLRKEEKSGELVGEIGIVRNITEQKKRREDLQMKKEYQELFEKSGDGLFVHDYETGRIRDVNKKTCEMYGYSREEFIGDTVEKTNSGEDPYTIERAERLVQKAKDEGPQTFEWHAKKKNGELFWVEVTLKVAEIDGEKKILANVRDITERKQAEENLQRLSSMVRQASDGMICTDTDFQITYMNKATEEMFGYQLEEVVGETPGIFNAEPNGQEIQKKIYDTVSSGETYQDVFLNRRKDGSKFYCEMKISPLVDEDGKLHGYMSSLRDITKRMEMEKKLKRSKKRFQEIFNNANDAMYLHEVTEEGRPGKFIEVNEKACEMLGYSPKEFLEMSPSDINSPKGQETVAEVMNKLQSDGEVVFEAEHKTKNGEKVPVGLSSHLFEMSGKEMILTVARDITERKEREQKLKRHDIYLKHIPEFVNVIDEKGRIKYLSHGSSESAPVGLSEVKASDGFKLIHPEDRERIQELFYEVRENPGEEYRTQLRGEIDEGWMWFEIRAINYLDDPEIEGIIVTSRDITERKKAEKALKKAKEELEELNENLEQKVEQRTKRIEQLLEQKDDFVNQLGHDLKSP